jgi:hypothetical protein
VTDLTIYFEAVLGKITTKMQFINPLIEKIRSRSREQWQAHYRERWTDLRIWIQEHGEQAAIVALVLGILFVLFFRLFIAIIMLALLAGYIVWHIAEPESRRSGPNSDSNPKTL